MVAIGLKECRIAVFRLLAANRNMLILPPDSPIGVQMHQAIVSRRARPERVEMRPIRKIERFMKNFYNLLNIFG